MKKKNSVNVGFILRNAKFQALNAKKRAMVLAALRRGRKYLSVKTNDSDDVAGLHYTLIHFGKMKDIVSISTSVLDNPICQARRFEEGTICSKCFSASQMDCYKNMQPCFKRNLDILTSRLLEPNEIPVILSKSGLGRGESFGDVCNEIQAANYMRIAAANPWLDWAVWTKNPIFYHRALQLELAEKPKNLNIVYSSKYINKMAVPNSSFLYFIDRVFTVYDDEGAKTAEINCGARSCATCRRCYFKSDKVYHIGEHLK